MWSSEAREEVVERSVTGSQVAPRRLPLAPLPPRFGGRPFDLNPRLDREWEESEGGREAQVSHAQRLPPVVFHRLSSLVFACLRVRLLRLRVCQPLPASACQGGTRRRRIRSVSHHWGAWPCGGLKGALGAAAASAVRAGGRSLSAHRACGRICHHWGWYPPGA